MSNIFTHQQSEAKEVYYLVLSMTFTGIILFSVKFFIHPLILYFKYVLYLSSVQGAVFLNVERTFILNTRKKKLQQYKEVFWKIYWRPKSICFSIIIKSNQWGKPPTLTIIKIYFKTIMLKYGHKYCIDGNCI